MYSKVLSVYNDELSRIYKYPKGAAIELEVRTHPDRAAFKRALAEALGKSYTVTTSIDIINGGKTKDIRRLVYRDGTKVESYERKTPIIKHKYSVPFEHSVAIAREEPIAKFANTAAAIVRFKHRVSYTETNWRIDLTAVYSTTIGADLVSMRDLYLKSPIQTMVDQAGVTYELEAEWNGKNITEADIQYIVGYLAAYSTTQSTAPSDNLLYHIAKQFMYGVQLDKFKYGSAGFKQLYPPVISITKNEYYQTYYPFTNWWVTEKTDGFHAYIVVKDGSAHIVAHDIKPISVESPVKDIIVEGELLDGTFYAFDCLVYGENVTKRPFSERYAKLGEIDIKIKDMTWKVKKFTHISDIKTDVVAIWNTKRDHPIDGLIFASDGANYAETVWIKWKPSTQQTIDFLARKCPQSLIGRKPFTVRDGYDIYILFVGINAAVHEKLAFGFVTGYEEIFGGFPSGGRYPIQFSPSANRHAYVYYHKAGDIDRAIVELSFDGKDWVFHKERVDRKDEPDYYGNDFIIAEKTYINVIDEFKLEDLWAPNVGYFTKTADKIYEAPNKYKRHALSVVMKNVLSDARYAIDLASGRGADLSRYIRSSVAHVLFVDIDSTAIAELLRRRMDMVRQKHKRGADADPPEKYGALDNLIVNAMVADLKTPHDVLLARTREFEMPPADSVICNFAIHYMCDTAANIRNLLQYVKGVLKVGGVFMFSTMSGARIHAIIGKYKRGEAWTVWEGDVKKYSIEKQYDGSTLTDWGQTIKIQLPLADTMYEEPLCNIDALIKLAQKMGFEPEINESFEVHYDSFKAEQPELFERLTPDDIKYINLHQIVTLRHIKNS